MPPSPVSSEFIFSFADAAKNIFRRGCRRLFLQLRLVAACFIRREDTIAPYAAFFSLSAMMPIYAPVSLLVISPPTPAAAQPPRSRRCYFAIYLSPDAAAITLPLLPDFSPPLI